MTRNVASVIVQKIRPDQLGQMYANGIFNGMELRAGRRLQASYVRLQSSVDRGEDKTIRKLQCELIRINKALGSVGEWLLYDVLVVGRSFREVAKKRDKNNVACRKGWQAVFRGYMEKLATVCPC